MKYEKMLALGMAIILSTNAFAVGNKMEQTYENLTQQVQMLQQANVIPKIDVNYLIKPTQEINQDRVKAEAKLNIATENCTVDINVTPDMKISYTGTPENREILKEVTGAENNIQEQLRTFYISYHEVAHCKMYEIANPFKAENPKVEQVLNDFFQFSGSNYSYSNKGDSGLYYILHENFADTFAFAQLIKNHGVSSDVLKTMQQIQIERSDAANTYNKNGLIAHNTEFSLQELLKEENIQKIRSIEDPVELQDFVLKISNDGMWKSIKTHGETMQVLNVDSLETGASFLFSGLMYKSIDLSSQKNIELKLQDNMLYKAAVETKQELQEKFDLSSIKTNEEMSSFLTKHQDTIKEILSQKVDKQLTYAYSNGLDVLDLVDNYANNFKPGDRMSTEDLKSNGAEAINVIEKIASKLSNGSTSDQIWEKINAIRLTQSNNTNIKSVHFKIN